MAFGQSLKALSPDTDDQERTTDAHLIHGLLYRYGSGFEFAEIPVLRALQEDNDYFRIADDPPGTKKVSVLLLSE